MTLLASLENFLNQIKPQTTYWIAYSGGLDSHVLLDMCNQLQKKNSFSLHVIHVNHGLSSQAKSWEKHCAEICKCYGIPFHAHTLQIEKMTGDSLEALAREKRYQIFANYLAEDDVLLTAHHQDDQAETLLLQLMRGAGVKGLAAMPLLKPFAKGQHARPLLNFPRQMLLQYAQENNLSWIEDESNAQLNLRRNFMRHQIMPLLQTHSSNVSTSIARSALHCSEAQALLEQFANEVLTGVRGSKENTLSVSRLLLLDEAKLALALRTWIHEQGHFMPATKKLAIIKKEILLAKKDRNPCVHWGQTELRRYRDDIYLMYRLMDHDPSQSFTWDLTSDLPIPNIGILMGSDVYVGFRKKHSTQPTFLVTVKFRVGGEVIFLNGQHHSLKNFFQEKFIPVWERDRIPLIFYDDKLICVVGHFIDERFVAEPLLLPLKKGGREGF